MAVAGRGGTRVLKTQQWQKCLSSVKEAEGQPRIQNDLDDKRVQVRSDHRPRARYLGGSTASTLPKLL